MKKISILFSLLVVALAGLSLAACSNDDLNTDQYDNGGVTLGAFGPSPVLRGGTLYFFGTHLDRVTSVVLPGQANPVTDIKVEQGGSHSKISILVPAEGGEPGYVTLKANDGTELTTKSKLTFREDISISKVYIGTEGTLTGEVGDLLVFEGDYLNLMNGVKFENGFIVSDLEEHTRYKLSVRIPKEAGSGTVTLTDLVEDTPTELQAEETITIKLPEVTAAAQTKKAGQTVTITGNRLTQIETVQLAGGVFVNSDELTYAENGSSLSFTLPEAAADGAITLITYSGQKIAAGTLTTVTPSNLAVVGKVKNGLQMVVTGTDMQLVKSVTFAPEVAYDAKDGITIEAGKVTIKKVPEAAVDGNLTLFMQNGKSTTVAYTLVKPAATSADPATLTAGNETVIYGTDLDLVAAITFPGESPVTVEAKNFAAHEAEGIQVTVPAACAGTGFTLIMKNGTEVPVSGILTIKAASDPAISEAPTGAVAGTVITVKGKNFNNLANLYVGTHKVTRYSSKSNTEMTFKVPEAPVGDYKFVLEDYDGNKFDGPAFSILPAEIDIASFSKWEDQSANITYPFTLSWSDSKGKVRIMRSGLQALNLKQGVSKLIFYKDPSTSGQIQLNNANWGNPITDADLTDWGQGKSKVETVFTADMMKCVNGEIADGWSDTAFIIQGDGMSITKITILP